MELTVLCIFPNSPKTLVVQQPLIIVVPCRLMSRCANHLPLRPIFCTGFRRNRCAKSQRDHARKSHFYTLSYTHNQKKKASSYAANC